MNDRRTGNDRRVDHRYRLNLDVEWEGTSGRWKGTINDISRAGCFVLGAGEVEDGDRVRIDFPLSTGGSVALHGVVVNHAYDIGFGLRFTDLTDAQREFIDRYIDIVRSD
jgi:hypothetical protein